MDKHTINLLDELNLLWLNVVTYTEMLTHATAPENKNEVRANEYALLISRARARIEAINLSLKNEYSFDSKNPCTDLPKILCNQAD